MGRDVSNCTSLHVPPMVGNQALANVRIWFSICDSKKNKAHKYYLVILRNTDMILNLTSQCFLELLIGEIFMVCWENSEYMYITELKSITPRGVKFRFSVLGLVGC